MWGVHLRKFHVLEKHGKGWSFSTKKSSIFKNLDVVFDYMTKKYGDFKVVAATDNFVIFETKDNP
jgi:hypothetical protein